MPSGEFAHFNDHKALAFRLLGSSMPNILRSVELLPDVTQQELAANIRFTKNTVPLARDGSHQIPTDQVISEPAINLTEIPL